MIHLFHVIFMIIQWRQLAGDLVWWVQDGFAYIAPRMARSLDSARTTDLSGFVSMLS